MRAKIDGGTREGGSTSGKKATTLDRSCGLKGGGRSSKLTEIIPSFFQKKERPGKRKLKEST